MPDPYADGTARGYWHLSRPSPEILEALDKGWLEPGMRVLDLGCGLATDIGFLGSRGFQVAGVDVSHEAVRQARDRYPDIQLEVGDVRSLPFSDQSFDYLLDRGCFHYLASEDRPRYAAEARRVLRSRGELLLRACLRANDIRNDIGEATIRQTFRNWHILQLETRSLPTDTRTIDALCARLQRPSG